MWARFTVLSDTPIAAAIAGCAIPLSRNNTIWMRWRCAAGIFHRSAVFSRRTSALLHLTICSSDSDGSSESHLHAEKQPVQAVSLPCPNRPDSRRYGAGISFKELVDAAANPNAATGRPLLVAIDCIDEDPDQPRRNFSEQELEELSQSIG